MNINVKSVITSGLVAGIIISLSAVTMVPMVGNEMDTVLANRGLPPLSNMAMSYFCFISLIFGIFLLFLYAILKPQFKSKTKAAISETYSFESGKTYTLKAERSNDKVSFVFEERKP